MATKNMKIEPAVKTIFLPPQTVSPGGTDIRFVDLSQIASIVNRRFYRQGLNWAVGGFKVIATQGSIDPTGNATVQGSIIATKIQETWVTSAAWEKSMRAWLRQQNDALAEMGAEGTAARFRDFKVFMDTNHVAKYVATPDLNLVNEIPSGYLTGEWEPSQVVLPNDPVVGLQQEYLLQFYGGDTSSAKDLIQGYATSRSFPTSPDPETPDVATSWLNLMNDLGNINDEVVDNAVDKNDNLPYDQESYPGQGLNKNFVVVHDQSRLTVTTVGGNTYLKGGMFPCGLIQFQTINAAESTQDLQYQIQIDLVAGPHRGYMCQPMMEM